MLVFFPVKSAVNLAFRHTWVRSCLFSGCHLCVFIGSILSALKSSHQQVITIWWGRSQSFWLLLCNFTCCSILTRSLYLAQLHIGIIALWWVFKTVTSFVRGFDSHFLTCDKHFYYVTLSTRVCCLLWNLCLLSPRIILLGLSFQFCFFLIIFLYHKVP